MKNQNLQQQSTMFLQIHSVAVSGPKRERGARSGQGYRAPAYRVVPGPARERWTRIASGGLCVRSCEPPWIGDKYNLSPPALTFGSTWYLAPVRPAAATPHLKVADGAADIFYYVFSQKYCFLKTHKIISWQTLLTN